MFFKAICVKYSKCLSTEQNGKCQQGDIQSQKYSVLTWDTKRLSLS